MKADMIGSSWIVQVVGPANTDMLNAVVDGTCIGGVAIELELRHADLSRSEQLPADPSRSEQTRAASSRSDPAPGCI